MCGSCFWKNCTPIVAYAKEHSWFIDALTRLLFRKKKQQVNILQTRCLLQQWNYNNPFPFFNRYCLRLEICGGEQRNRIIQFKMEKYSLGFNVQDYIELILVQWTLPHRHVFLFILTFTLILLWCFITQRKERTTLLHIHINWWFVSFDTLVLFWKKMRWLDC